MGCTSPGGTGQLKKEVLSGGEMGEGKEQGLWEKILSQKSGLVDSIGGPCRGVKT